MLNSSNICIFIMFLICNENSKIDEKFLETSASWDTGWLCSSDPFKTNDSVIYAYSNERLFLSHHSRTCPYIGMFLENKTLLNITKFNHCKGGEPPEGETYKFYSWPYKITTLEDENLISFIPYDDEEIVFTISIIKEDVNGIVLKFRRSKI